MRTGRSRHSGREVTVRSHRQGATAVGAQAPAQRPIGRQTERFSSSAGFGRSMGTQAPNGQHVGRLACACTDRPRGNPCIARGTARTRSIPRTCMAGKAAFGLRAAVGSAAAPGDAGEALVGQTSSSGVRLSDWHVFESQRGMIGLARFILPCLSTAIAIPARARGRYAPSIRLLVNTYRRFAAKQPARAHRRPMPASTAPAPCRD